MFFENIKPGDHVIVIEREGCIYQELNGIPLEVVALSWPFVAVKYHGQLCSLDYRACRLTKALPAYVAAFTPGTTQKPTCPVCRDGVFACVTERCSEPHWVCSECGAVVVEKACQCD